MHLVATRTSYNAGKVRIVDWRPGGRQDTGRCGTVKLSLAHKGVGISGEAERCPERWDIHPPHVKDGRDIFDSHWSRWNGVRHESRQGLGVDRINGDARNSGFGYSIRYRWS
jgi:hypothetical protein